MSKINNRVLTERKFLRASEDPSGAAKALVIRRGLDKCEMYKTNLDTAKGIFETAETSILRISEITTTATDSIIQGVNGSQGDDDRKIIAKALRNMAGEMINQANTDYADRKLFGGTNNESGPFSYDETTDIVSFNGVNIDTNDINLFPQTKDIYVDVGMGIKFDAAGNVDKQTAMNVALNGAKILGYGTDSDGDSQNIIKLTLDAAKALEANDIGSAKNLLNKIHGASSKVMIGVTDIGSMQKAVDYNTTRVEDEEYNLKVAQKSVEGVDTAEEITKYKTAEAAYNATLAMGSKVIPRSIFDFI